MPLQTTTRILEFAHVRKHTRLRRRRWMFEVLIQENEGQLGTKANYHWGSIFLFFLFSALEVFVYIILGRCHINCILSFPPYVLHLGYIYLWRQIAHRTNLCECVCFYAYFAQSQRLKAYIPVHVFEWFHCQSKLGLEELYGPTYP
jgi:hypothetical protein